MYIVLITRDRPELTRQTIETMKANAAHWNKHKLVIIFDGEDSSEYWQSLGDIPAFIYSTGRQLGVGGAKNYGVDTHNHSETFGLADADILMFSDNDMYYLPGWDDLLENGLRSRDNDRPHVVQLGGWKHPYHQLGQQLIAVGIGGVGYGYSIEGYEVDAVTGNCFVIRYKDWLKYGPFDANALGPGQSEDFALSQKIKAGGGLVATLDPPVAIHCGLRNCLGEPATGWVEMAAMAEKQLEENNIQNIWLEVPDEGLIHLERQDSKHNNGIEFRGINCGSGQRRFDTSCGWINVDVVSRPPDQVPDVICDANQLDTKFTENSQDMVVLHHVLEHFGCGEADEVLRQCYKVLKPGGSLLIFVPDLRKLAGRWLAQEIDDYIFCVNIYGAYMSEEGDRHKWGYTKESLEKYIQNILPKATLIPFNWRMIPGADLAKDWWVLSLEAVK